MNDDRKSDQTRQTPRSCTVEVSIDAHEGRARAIARLRWRDQESVGIGLANRGRRDRENTEIGDELAVAFALSDLADQLLTVTTEEIEAISDR